jgi:Restriction Enzyme Adenine Methylase Associated
MCRTAARCHIDGSDRHGYSPLYRVVRTSCLQRRVRFRRLHLLDLGSTVTPMSLYVRDQDGGLLPVRAVAPGPELYESEIEELVWSNLELFAGEALFPLCRQAGLPGGGRPDIIALDSVGRVWVIEVKRDVERHQVSQALEYAGWARSTNLDEVARLYPAGGDAFFRDWLKFTESATPVLVNHTPRLLLIARDVHARTQDALRFLGDSGVPVTVVPVSLYEDDAGRRLVDIERESEITSSKPTDLGGSSARSQRTYKVDGHLVRTIDLVEAGLLAAGTDIEMARRGASAQAVITAVGTIKIGDREYSTPSAAGAPLVGHSVDGWVSWRVPSKGNQTLAEIRLELLERNASATG